MITIVDYDVGNLKSIQNMLRHLGIASTISGSPDEIMKAEKLILPGVGRFDHGMKHLAESGLQPALDRRVMVDHTPLLGICLGAQLLTKSREEGERPGLGWIDAKTVAFDRERVSENLRVPHMGWADTEFAATSKLFEGVEPTPRFYYVHSYHMVCSHEQDALCHAEHGHRFVAAVENANVVGVQFHPEKSHKFGMKILRNFSANY